MQCPRCQHDNRAQAKFCEECAAPLARTCPNCGTQVSPAAKFCSECAHAVTEPVPTQTRYTSPETYTPKHLAEKILTSKSALEGERKQVTVLFADLKGSMELLADRDPEEARKLLDPVLERMMEAVHRYEGTVNQVMGDGIMALFGAPVAHEDHAVRACYAALDMQAAIRRDAEEVRRRHGVVIQIRVGLNSGEVVVRAIGSDLRMDYTAVGQTTHLAARMEQLRQARHDPADRRRAPSRGRVHRGHAARPGARQGPERAGRALRDDGSWATSLEAARGGGPRPHPVHRPGGGAGAGAPGHRSGRCGVRPGGRPRRGAGRREVAARLGGDALPPDPRVAHRGGGVQLLREGDPLPAGHRPPQGLLPGRGPGRARGRCGRR